jgi:sugar O-acyltransferase (sialic acid O-acetyltransferase NeuD family)
MDNPVIIFGASGIAKAALEIFQSNQIEVYGFLDDNQDLHQTEINNIPILGSTDDHGFLKLIGQKCEAFVATDERELRKELVEMLNTSRKTMPVNAVHQHALISKSFSLGHGNFINAGTLLSNDSSLGSHSIIHSGVILEQDVKIGDFVQVGAGTIINSEVVIADGAFIGSGVTIVSGVTIGRNARIGAGSVVVSSVDAEDTVFGNPAVSIDKK